VVSSYYPLPIISNGIPFIKRTLNSNLAFDGLIIMNLVFWGLIDSLFEQKQLSN